MNPYDNAEETAISYLTHYFRLAVGKWNCDNDSEIQACVEAIINAAKRPLQQEIEMLKKEIEALKEFKDELETSKDINFMTQLYRVPEE